VRIIGGMLRSRKFDAPPGMATRPTADRAKGALFNILQGRLEGAAVLDGFAGSGALSFEAVSRGAASAVLFETDRVAVSLIRKNASALGIADRLDIRQADFLGGVAGIRDMTFDVILLDPPYASGLLEKAVEASAGVLKAGGIIAAEHGDSMVLPDMIGPLKKTDERNYGTVSFSFYKRQEKG
jgi:16S rRNA (guanine966-N2)-methyltransferase